MQTLILQAVQALYTNGGARRPSIRGSSALTPGGGGSLGRALYGMRHAMNVGKGYGGAYSGGYYGSGSGGGSPYAGSSPVQGPKPKPRGGWRKKRKKTKKPMTPTQKKMSRPRKSTYKGRPDRPRLNRPVRGRRNQRLAS